MKTESRQKVRLLNNLVAVRRKESESKTRMGIIIPEVAKQKSSIGEVVYVGPGLQNDKGERMSMTVSVTDQVVFSLYSGNEIELNGESLLLLSENDILGIIE